MAGHRRIKGHVQECLEKDDWKACLQAMAAEHGTGSLVGPLFGFILNRSSLVRWRAVSGFGVTMDMMFAADPEKTRNVMRRFLWHMNEESANVPWGIAEVMGEVMACVPTLADEYYKKLASYIQEEIPGHESNFLQYAGMREGVFWGLMRLAQARPELVEPYIPDLMKAFEREESCATVAYVALTMADLQHGEAKEALQSNAEEPDEFELYRDEKLETAVLGDVVKSALAKLG
jgi:hypothetical protein